MTRSRSIGRRRRFLSLLLVLAFLGGAVALLAEVERRADQTVVVGPGEVVGDDLYASGEVVRIEGTVRGDLVAVAREVIVEGTIEGDLIAAGQAVSITGTVGDDVRIAGQVLHLGPEARVGDDVVAAGFSLEAQGGSSIGGTVLTFGYQALLDGEVAESVRGALAALELAGTVERDLEVKVGPRGEQAPPAFGSTPIAIPTVASGLTLADGARIGGDLRYESPDEAEIASGAAVAGEVAYRPAPGEEEPTASDRILDALRRFAALLLVGGLLLLVAPGWTAGLAAIVRERPLPSLGWGLVFLLAAIAACLVLAFATAFVAAILGFATLTGLAVATVALGVLAELGLGVGLVLAGVYL
ncbi:MAG TPA: polymer-forming cytoskeletal protein, partial [Thermoanaerobaculia bacterium]|nr:polymer-forming cytoskeletal protein [Thermoanaerobaculia bacterium]